MLVLQKNSFYGNEINIICHIIYVILVGCKTFNHLYA